jgi:hypothetical protein
MLLVLNTVAMGWLALAQPTTAEPATGGPENLLVDVEGTDNPSTAATDLNPIKHLWPQDLPITVRGWLDGGFVGNTGNPGSKFNGPYNSVERSDEPMFNQAYLIIERLMGNEFTFGGRVDLLYGTDYVVAQSYGFEKNRDGSPRWNSN